MKTNMTSPGMSICRSCRLRLSQPHIRLFSSSQHRCSIPPESPRYIDVPASYQPEFQTPPRQKGVLPVPRELFPHQRPDKPSAEYIQNVTRDTMPKNTPDEASQPELRRHKNRMTEIRKHHLREGLKELHARKQLMTSRVAERSAKKQDQRAALLVQAEREDARLTSVSTPQAMLPKNSTIKFADERAVYERKLANIAKQDLFGAQKTEGRRNALHNLYMNARNFITTEQQLNEAIELEFPADGSNLKWTDIARSSDHGKNVWNLGPPPSIADMLKGNAGKVSAGGYSDQRMRQLNALHEKDQKRMKRIAEELSGGRM